MIQSHLGQIRPMPIPSMYGYILIFIYHKNEGNVDRYTIHRWHGRESWHLIRVSWKHNIATGILIFNIQFKGSGRQICLCRNRCFYTKIWNIVTVFVLFQDTSVTYIYIYIFIYIYILHLRINNPIIPSIHSWHFRSAKQ